MSVKLTSEITLPSKKAVYPTKTTMNLMQHESTAQKLPGRILVGMLAAAVLLLLAKVAVYDPLTAYRAEQNTLEQRETELAGYTAQLSDYQDVETRYRCYSYGYLTEEEAALVDVLRLVDASKTILDRYGSLASLAVSQNAVSVVCRVSALSDLSRIVSDFYDLPEVTSVTVGSASDAESDGTIRASFVVTAANPASDTAAAKGGEG